MNRLVGATIATIGTLTLFLFVILWSIITIAEVDLPLTITIPIIIVFNFGMLMIAPFIQDFIYRFMYKVRWYKPEEIQLEYPWMYDFVTKVTTEKRFKFPKIGIIPDDNPQAFCYGSHRSNGRVVITNGLMRYLTKEETNAVVAHELGHIYNLDFIIMTLASTLLQIIYELSRVLMRLRSSRERNNPLPLIGLVAYAMYFVGRYILLLLSRVREYYADKFSAEVTGNPELLARALFKIAYGILRTADKGESGSGLMETTCTLGIMDVKGAKSTTNYAKMNSNPEDEPQTLDLPSMFPYMVFDVKSPWAFIGEISSTHPLTAKRILALGEMASEGNVLSSFREYLAKLDIDKSKLYGKFVLDYVVKNLAVIFAVLFALLAFALQLPIFLVFLGIALGLLIRIFYCYPRTGYSEATIGNLMKDVYASPVRGTPATLSGRIIGRGIPGYVFGKDIMIQDSTGLVFVQVKTILGFITDFLFAVTKVKNVIGKTGKAHAYFFRSVSPWTILRNFEGEEAKFKSYPELGILLAAIFWLILGVVVTALVGTL